jgi:hypothetical protein
MDQLLAFKKKTNPFHPVFNISSMAFGISFADRLKAKTSDQFLG